MKRALSLITAVLLIVTLFSGCAETGELTLIFGETRKIELSKEYEELTWESSDPAVATVNNGTVTGAGPGQVTITALSGTKKVAQYTVTVEIVEIKELFLQSSELTLDIGESTTLFYTLFPTDASAYGLTYTSINPEVATVEQNGTVTGVAVGKTNIVISTQSGVTAACEVTVKEPSAIEQLNEEESKVFEYLTSGGGLNSFYNASAVRFRNLYTYKATAEDYVYSANSLIYADIQGTNKLGGTIYKYYMLLIDEDGSGFFWACTDDFSPGESQIEFPRDIIDYVKLNAALDEYWNGSGITK